MITSRLFLITLAVLSCVPVQARPVIATVYHQYYDGRPAYCGGTYYDHRVSAAHAWLPCGTQVSVYYKGRTLVVPITDRCECNSIDLSYRAAKILGVPVDGIARVHINY